ncbi:hypothetical protein HMPREF9120_01649 [Neisseria sp. oral taxon 020 str. F0370]|nr:hypothetical protein HMPREF9120_01649 [Neisseria sp. oral taxon 020 str. F0370]
MAVSVSLVAQSAHYNRILSSYRDVVRPVPASLKPRFQTVSKP